MSRIEDNICEAIELIVEKSVKEAGYDRTIQATIKSCEDESIGKYRVKYQDSLFYAYTNSADVSYGAGTLVYVLVPQNDMTKEKTILGSVDKLGSDYFIPTEKADNNYDIIGSNGVSQVNSLKLSSYLNELREIYNVNSTDNVVSVDNAALRDYFAQAESLICGATFKTSLVAEQQIRGNYGIIFTLEFKGEVDETQTYQKDYVVDIDSMTGNPYQLELGKRQFGIYKVPGASFNRVISIILFTENFPIQKDKSEVERDQLYDIDVSNIEVNAASVLSSSELNGCALSLLTLDGAIFSENASENSTIPINAQVKIKGKVADPEIQKIPFYWFIEDLTINNKSKLYNKYGGKGWRCLNEYNVIDEASRQIEWVNKGPKLALDMKTAASRENKIKCVCVYNGNTYNKIITVKNYKNTLSVTLVSDSGTEFYYGVGSPTITCLIDGKENTGYAYSWAVEDEYGNLTQLESAENKLRNIQVQTIVDFNIYKCTVLDSTGTIRGTAQIKIANLLETKDSYNLVIHNGTQIFNYDENGVSPASKANDNPISIETLTFSVYDNVGREISNDVIKHGTIQWKVPIKDTMLTNIIADAGTTTVDAKQENRTFNQALELAYSIQNKYYYNYKNNDIELTIQYKEMNLKAKTNLVFTKQGESGTNGSAFSCQIVPNTTSAAPKYAVLNMTDKASDGSYRQGYFNFGAEQFLISTSLSTRAPFKVVVYKDGEEVFSGSQSSSDQTVLVSWSMLANTYTSKFSDASDLNISEKYGTMSYTGLAHDKLESGTKAGANIIKCTVYYNKDNDKQTLTVNLPVIISYVTNPQYRIYLKDYSGFSYVQYTSDGALPKYDNTNPFEVEVYNNSALVNTSYNWSKAGNYYSFSNEAFVDSQDLVHLNSSVYTNKLAENQRNFKPIANYKGICVNNTVICECGNYGTIYIPIHFYLNKYGLSQLNGWDGNSINIDEDGGFILAPQMGAGSKNAANQFTGVLMGEVQESNKQNVEIGLFGYADGARSFTLDASDGHAIFGQGQGSFTIDPSAGKALLYSGNYWKNYKENNLPASYESSNKSGEGFLIDLNSARMESGSGGFILDGDTGYVTIQHGGTIGGWKISDSNLTSNDGKTGLAIKTNNDNDLAFWSGGSGNNSTFSVTHGGYLKTTNATIGSGSNKITIGKSSSNNAYSALYSGSHNNLDSTNSGFYLGTDGFSLGSNFKVTNGGTLTAKSGTIAGWTIGTRSLYSGKTGWSSGSGSGVYLGTDGIGLGDNFSVSSSGTLTAKSGSIGNWNISNGSLTGSGVTLSTSGISLGSSFSVNNNGYLTSTSGTIGGWSIGTSTLTAGSMSLGNDGSISGRGWSINANGYATFSNVNITGGSISVGGSTFSNSGGSTLSNGTSYRGSRLDNYVNGRIDAKIGDFETLLVQDSFSLQGHTLTWITVVAGPITIDSLNLSTGSYSLSYKGILALGRLPYYNNGTSNKANIIK